MGNPQLRRSVRAMRDRWAHDERRLAEMFGAYEPEDFSEASEMQRNLGTAIAYANSFLAKFTTTTI